MIKEVLPSNDGLVRKVIITTNGKHYTRPITHLVPLEYNVNENKNIVSDVIAFSIAYKFTIIFVNIC